MCHNISGGVDRDQITRITKTRSVDDYFKRTVDDGLATMSSLFFRKSCVRFFSWFLLAVFILEPVSTDGYVKCESSSKQVHSRLRSDLLCDYEKDIRPRLDKDKPITVEVKAIITHYDYMMHSYTLTINCWIYLTWEDDHLKWKAEEYENVKTMKFTTEEIWTPHLSLYNALDNTGDTNLIGHQECKVLHSGRVLCVIPARLDSYCLPDLKRYPYDVQSCSQSMGAWVDVGEELNFTFAATNRTIDLRQTYANPEWEIVEAKSIRHELHYSNFTYPILEMRFNIKRTSTTVIAITVLPSFLLCLLTLLTFFLRPDDHDRLVFSLANIIIHVLHLTNIIWQLPDGGKETPLIITFCRDSLLMATVTLVLIVLQRRLLSLTERNEASTPDWMRRAVGAVLNNKIGQIVFLFKISPRRNHFVGLDEDGKEIVAETEESTASASKVIETDRKVDDQVNRLFAKITDRTVFLIFALVYFVLIINYIP